MESGNIITGSNFRLYGSKIATKLISYDPLNFTGLTGDRLLRAGEVAYIDYTLATSVPLHIQTEEGIYEIDCIGARTQTLGATGPFYVLPNNTTQTGILGVNHQIGVTVPSNTVNACATTRFELGSDLLIHGKYTAMTYIGSKSFIGTNVYKYTNNSLYRDQRTYEWSDTTTAWTSLGTLTFPFAQSGKIVIRRII